MQSSAAHGGIQKSACASSAHLCSHHVERHLSQAAQQEQKAQFMLLRAAACAPPRQVSGAGALAWQHAPAYATILLSLLTTCSCPPCWALQV